MQQYRLQVLSISEMRCGWEVAASHRRVLRFSTQEKQNVFILFEWSSGKNLLGHYLNGSQSVTGSWPWFWIAIIHKSPSYKSMHLQMLQLKMRSFLQSDEGNTRNFATSWSKAIGDFNAQTGPKKDEWEVTVIKSFSALANLKTEQQSSDELWTAHKKVYGQKVANIVRYKKRQTQSERDRWISDKNSKQSMKEKHKNV